MTLLGLFRPSHVPDPFPNERFCLFENGLKNIKGDDNDKELIDMMINNCREFVLKPQREGGGNKVFGQDIKYYIYKVQQLFHSLSFERS